MGVYLGLAKYQKISVKFHSDVERVSDKRYNDVSRNEYRYLTLPLRKTIKFTVYLKFLV